MQKSFQEIAEKEIKKEDAKIALIAKKYFAKKMKTIKSRKAFFKSIGGKTDKNGKLIIGK